MMLCISGATFQALVRPLIHQLHNYILFIRSVTEYCAVAFHSSLTIEQSDKLEKIQKTCLKVILGVMYIDYSAALEMCGLQTLSDRRGKRCLDFSLKCIKHEKNNRIFPVNHSTSEHYIRNKETFQVNFARTEDYKESAVPYCQRLIIIISAMFNLFQGELRIFI